MAIKADYYKYNGTAWELFHFRTSADLIHETANRKIMTVEERGKIDTYLTTFNVANKLLKLDGSNKVPTTHLPPLNYLPLAGGTVTGVANFTNKIKTDLIQGISEKVNIALEDSQDYPNLVIGSTGSGQMEIRDFDYLQLHTILNMNSNKIAGVANPTQPYDAVNKFYVDNLVSSNFTTRASVKCASTSNVNISQVVSKIDTIDLATNDRVLLKNQTTASENGVYKKGSDGKLSKVEEDSKLGSAVFVEEGATNNDYIYHHSTQNSWVAFSKPDTILAGNGLTKTGTTLSIENGAIVNTMLASGISASKLTGTISSDRIANNSIYDTKLSNIMIAENIKGWTAIDSMTTSKSLRTHLWDLYSAIKNLRGTTNFNDNNTKTIQGAYDAIPQIVVNSSSPQTGFPNAKAGDLYFQTLSS